MSKIETKIGVLETKVDSLHEEMHQSFSHMEDKIGAEIKKVILEQKSQREKIIVLEEAQLKDIKWKERAKGFGIALAMLIPLSEAVRLLAQT